MVVGEALCCTGIPELLVGSYHDTVGDKRVKAESGLAISPFPFDAVVDMDGILRRAAMQSKRNKGK